MKAFLPILLWIACLFPANNLLAQPDCWSWMIGNIDFDRVDALSVDIEKNFWIGGSFNGTVDFDPGPDSFPMISTTFSTAYLASYTDSGTFRFAFALPNMQIFDIAHDSNQNAYVIGYHTSSGDADPGPGVAPLPVFGGTDVCVLSYDAGGDFRWAKGFGGPGADQGNSVGVDEAGNVLVTGTFSLTADFGTDTMVSHGGTDLFASKMSGTGDQIWNRSYGGNGFESKGYGAFMSGGPIYPEKRWFFAAGFCDSLALGGSSNPLLSQGESDVFLAQMDSSGTPIWALSLGGIEQDNPSALVADDLGNAYLAGNFRSELAAYNINGTVLAGSPLHTSRGESDNFLIAVDSAGKYLWNRSSGSVESDQLNSLHWVNATNRILVAAGTFRGQFEFDADSTQETQTLISQGFSNIFLAQHNPASGRIISHEGYGETEGTNTPSIRLISYSNSVRALMVGRTTGTVDFTPPERRIDCATPMVHTSTGGFDFFATTIDLPADTLTAIQPLQNLASLTLSPNPTSNTLTVEWEAEQPRELGLRLFDLSGKLLREIHQPQVSRQGDVQLSLEELSSGIYLLEVRLGQQLSRHKVVKR